MFIIVFFLWLILGVAVGAYASSKGHSFWGYFFISLLLSPVISLVIAIVIPENKIEISTQAASKFHRTDLSTVNDVRTCPFCAEEVRREAILCKHCKSQLPELTEIEKETISQVEKEISIIEQFEDLVEQPSGVSTTLGDEVYISKGPGNLYVEVNGANLYVAAARRELTEKVTSIAANS